MSKENQNKTSILFTVCVTAVLLAGTSFGLYLDYLWYQWHPTSFLIVCGLSGAYFVGWSIWFRYAQEPSALRLARTLRNAPVSNDNKGFTLVEIAIAIVVLVLVLYWFFS